MQQDDCDCNVRLYLKKDSNASYGAATSYVNIEDKDTAKTTLTSQSEKSDEIQLQSRPNDEPTTSVKVALKVIDKNLPTNAQSGEAHPTCCSCYLLFILYLIICHEFILMYSQWRVLHELYMGVYNLWLVVVQGLPSIITVLVLLPITFRKDRSPKKRRIRIVFYLSNILYATQLSIYCWIDIRLMLSTFPSAKNATCECEKLGSVLPDSSAEFLKHEPLFKNSPLDDTLFCDCLVPLRERNVYTFLVQRKHHKDVRENLLKFGVNFTERVSFVAKKYGVNDKYLKDKSRTRTMLTILQIAIVPMTLVWPALMLDDIEELTADNLKTSLELAIHALLSFVDMFQFLDEFLARTTYFVDHLHLTNSVLVVITFSLIGSALLQCLLGLDYLYGWHNSKSDINADKIGVIYTKLFLAAFYNFPFLIIRAVLVDMYGGKSAIGFLLMAKEVTVIIISYVDFCTAGVDVRRDFARLSKKKKRFVEKAAFHLQPTGHVQVLKYQTGSDHSRSANIAMIDEEEKIDDSTL